MKRTILITALTLGVSGVASAQLPSLQPLLTNGAGTANLLLLGQPGAALNSGGIALNGTLVNVAAGTPLTAVTPPVTGAVTLGTSTLGGIAESTLPGLPTVGFQGSLIRGVPGLPPVFLPGLPSLPPVPVVPGLLGGASSLPSLGALPVLPALPL